MFLKALIKTLGKVLLSNLCLIAKPARCDSLSMGRAMLKAAFYILTRKI